LRKEDECQDCINFEEGKCVFGKQPKLRTVFKDKYGETIEIWECISKMVREDTYL